MIEVPIFHVNGDDPDAVVYVAELALRFRQEFHREVVIDMVCYRRHGHNEGDEPRFTQPQMYERIDKHPTVRRQWAATLVDRGTITPQWGEQLFQKHLDQLNEIYQSLPPEPPPTLEPQFPPPPGAAAPPRGSGRVPAGVPC